MKHFLQIHRVLTISVFCVIAFLIASIIQTRRTYDYEQRLIRRFEQTTGPIFLVDSKHPPAPPFAFLPDVLPLVIRKSKWPLNKLPGVFHPELFERVVSIDMFDCETSDEAIDIASGFSKLEYIQIPENSVSEKTLRAFGSLRPDTKIVIGLGGD